MADGWADLPSLILIGEIHGSREIPKVVLALAASTISRGLSVSIGLEMETSEQHALDAYMASAGTDADVTKLLSGAHWRLEDGRASEAILEIIEFARRQPERCKCFCLDSPAPAPRASPDHSRAMAKAALPQIRCALDRGDVVLCLAGSTHCRGEGIHLGALLKAELRMSKLLVVRWPASSAVWSYDASDVRRPFGVHAIAPTCSGSSGGVRLTIFDAPDGGFDGAIELDSALTPSLPARHAHGMATEKGGRNSCCGIQ